MSHFTLPPLPYPENALEPVVSAKTLSFHYGKHHKAYLDKLNTFADEDASLASMSLEEVIKTTAGKSDKTAVFNNAAQVWNHSFYWQSLREGGGGVPGKALKDRIDAAFDGFDNFKKELLNAAVTQFGSGWAWLVIERDKLKVVKTANAEVPFVRGQKPLLTIDVWEHAYYLDYQNRRNDYANALIDKLINWEFVEKNLG